MKYKDKILFEKEYGIFKFKVPTKNERDEALGLAGETIMFKKLEYFMLIVHNSPGFLFKILF